MLYARLALVGVGAVEGLSAAYVLTCTSAALPCVFGRTLSVGASPALLPALAQAGALRLGLAIFIVAAGLVPLGADAAHKFAAAAAAHVCVLQPFVATARSHASQPVGGRLALSLLEGAALVGGVAADEAFDAAALRQMPPFLAAAAFLAIGLAFALAAAGRAACCAGVRVGNSSAPLGTPLQGDLAKPLFDDERHRLSPMAKRLLS